jgi:isopentenyl-diphosphate delta-isomerase
VKESPISSRKSDHIRISLEQDVDSALTTGLEDYRFVHRALPELDLDEIDMSQELFGRSIQAPILISSMTGGTEEAGKINRVLAEAAEACGIAMGVGSQRAAIEHSELIPTFQIRSYAPHALLFANLGAVQLNYGYTIDECRRAVDMLAADALYLHFNALQEAVQPEGDTRFAGLAARVETICKQLAVPVIAKEVGWGFSKPDVRLLRDAGVAAIDVAGAGGTSWSQVEMHRAKNDSQKRLAAAFINWGVPTAQAILNVRETAPNLKVFASGGIRSGMEIAKSLALGADLGGMAGPFLKAAVRSLEETVLTIHEIKREIQVTMFMAGVRNLAALQQVELTHD